MTQPNGLSISNRPLGQVFVSGVNGLDISNRGPDEHRSGAAGGPKFDAIQWEPDWRASWNIGEIE